MYFWLRKGFLVNTSNLVALIGEADDSSDKASDGATRHTKTAMWLADGSVKRLAMKQSTVIKKLQEALKAYGGGSDGE